MHAYGIVLKATDFWPEEHKALQQRADSPSQRLTMEQATDAEVYAQLKRGSQAALGALYDRYSRVVYRLALRLLTSEQEAQDLTQEVFLILWQKRAFDPSRGSLSSYLLTLTRSRAIDRLRSRSSNLRFLSRFQREVSETSAQTPLEQASLEERSHRVRSALKELPDAQREALELAYYENLSQSEIAARLATPLGTIKTRSRQGLLRLRNLLQDLLG